MGLYLCLFENDEDIDGVEVGTYGDFDAFRSFITDSLESGKPGSRFPTLILHSDCDGEWSVQEAVRLADELALAREEMRRLPPVPFASEWQGKIARSNGLTPRNALESFIDVDGECLMERLTALAEHAIAADLPISFQ
jgi:hypothetical protein